MPKFLETQFNLEPSFSAVLVGVCIVVFGALATGLLGEIIKRKKLSHEKVLLIMFIGTAIQLPLMFVFRYVRCDTIQFGGGGGGGGGFDASMTLPCNEGCSCLSSSFEPVCVNGVNFFSPCHAGCTEHEINFLNCACANASLNYDLTSTTSSSSSSSPSAFSAPISTDGIPGLCPDSSCSWQLWLFWAIFALLAMPLVSARYLAMESTLRVVPRDVKSWATGIQLLLFNLIGSLPGPLIYGGILDGACLNHQNEAGVGGDGGGADAGEGGACVIYDKLKLGEGMFDISFPMKLF